MSEKQVANLEARKQGQKMERPAQLSSSAVSDLISSGQYTLKYDKKGLHRAGPSASNPDSTWYEFIIYTGSNKAVGYYHIHPDSRMRCGYASGNMRMYDDSSFGSYLVGRARDWQWLCNQLNK